LIVGDGVVPHLARPIPPRTAATERSGIGA
jgi:hypothetical protein